MKPRFLIAAHDAGGAEILSSWVRRTPGAREASQFVLDGPAVEIFERKLNLCEQTRPPRLHSFRTVLTGTSLHSTLEKDIIMAAWDARVRSVVWLDHWKNYAARFALIPDQVWVCDKYAAALAKQEIPLADVRIKGNPYLDDFVAEVAEEERLKLNDGKRILYCTEPEYEEEAYVYFERLARLAAPPPARLHLHPAEAEGTYQALTDRYKDLTGRALPISGNTLAQDVAWAKTVVGADTAALVAALAARRQVFSVLPTGSLPFRGIERLR